MNKQMTTLERVWERVEKMSSGCFDELVPVNEIRFESLERVRIMGEVHPMREMAQREFSYRLGIPIPYLKKCDPDVQAYNLNHWLEKERNEKLFVRFDGQEVRAVFTPRYKPVDHFEILMRLDELGISQETEVQCHLDQNFMLLNIPDQGEFSVDQRGKDKMRPGISIGNSEVGIRSLSVSAFILRLICTNGMIGTTDVTKSYRHVSSKVLEHFPEALAQVTRELGNQKQRLKFSLESRVDNPETTLKSFNRQFQLNPVEQEAVDWAWPQENGENMFSIIQTYTRAAQAPAMPAESSYKLQRVGGNILAMVNN
jgi:hypothetical protein